MHWGTSPTASTAPIVAAEGGHNATLCAPGPPLVREKMSAHQIT